MKPDFLAAAAIGLQAFRRNLTAILSIQAVMALMVFSFYFWPAAAELYQRYGDWQAGGGIWFVALATAVGGGVISELFLVYTQQGGRWFRGNVENLVFKFCLCFIAGAIVAVFYRYQAIWFGEGHTWQVLVPKVLVDQFIFSAFWSTPYNTIASRWKMLGYSWSRVGAELGPTFVVERMFPMLVTNWLFWIPTVTLVYALPLTLETPLYIFASAIWGILLIAVSQVDPPVASLNDHLLIVEPSD